MVRTRIVKGGVAVALMLAATGCKGTSKEVEACEALLLPSLKAPSTYKLVTATSRPTGGGHFDVALGYDAVNSYNAPIRDTFLCAVDSTGRASAALVKSEPTPDLLNAIENAAEDQAADHVRARASIADDNPFEVPVCDRPDSPEKLALMNEIGVGCGGE